jgi:hypothetical protein
MDPRQSSKQEQKQAKCCGAAIRFAQAVAALALGAACASSVLAREGTHGPQVSNSDGASPSVAQLVFNGTTGTVGMNAHHNDQLVFAAGEFHSRECKKLGFEKSSVEIDRDDDGIRFSAVNTSEKYGTLTWNGSIRNGVIEARYVWKKQRLFWTIEREYWFSGEIRDAVN